MHLALVVSVAGNHPHCPSVPLKQLIYNFVNEHPVIATQVIPLVVQYGDTN